MKNILKYTLLLFLPALAACSNEEDGSMPATAQPQPGDALQLTVSTSDFITYGSPDTRATDNGLKTTFENGDRIGITCLDASGNILANNVPYKYNNGTWSFNSNNGKGKSQCYYDKRTEKYIVYFPYNEAADGVTTIEDLKKTFPPKLNQNTKDAYRASDLMTWSADSGPQKTLNIELTHAYASVSFFLQAGYVIDDNSGSPIRLSLKISDVNLTIGDKIDILPYHEESDGSFRYILPVDPTVGDIRCFYTISNQTYSITKSGSLIANTCYTFALAETQVTYTLADAKFGDFYCRRSSDKLGYLIPGDIDVKAVEGLETLLQKECVGVVFTTEEEMVQSLYGGHGVAVALNDTGIRSDFTNTMKNAANQYRQKVLAPKNSSNWSIPNLHEMARMCRGYSPVRSVEYRDKLHKQFDKVPGAKHFQADCYWPNSFVGADQAFYVNFSDGEHTTTNISNEFLSRCVLYF